LQADPNSDINSGVYCSGGIELLVDGIPYGCYGGGGDGGEGATGGDDGDDGGGDGPDCVQGLIDDISSFLTNNDSPLAKEANLTNYDLAAYLVTIGGLSGVDPRLFVAISGEESNFGRSHAAKQYNNAFGLKGAKGVIHFNSVDSAIRTEGKTVKNLIYNSGEDSVSKLYSGKKGAYCVGAGCTKGAATVTGYLKNMGGDANKLAFPCPEKE
jgi:hypothetical protein